MNSGMIRANHPTKAAQQSNGYIYIMDTELTAAINKDTVGLSYIRVLEETWGDLSGGYVTAYDGGNGIDALLDEFFGVGSLMSTVRSECEKTGLDKKPLLESQFRAVNNSFTAHLERKRADEERARADDLAAQLEAIKQVGGNELLDEFMDWFDQNKWLAIGIAAGGMVGLGIFSYFLKFFIQCCECCLTKTGDYGDTERKVVVLA